MTIHTTALMAICGFICISLQYPDITKEASEECCSGTSYCPFTCQTKRKPFYLSIKHFTTIFVFLRVTSDYIKSGAKRQNLYVLLQQVFHS